jgi:hypothetical protein
LQKLYVLPLAGHYVEAVHHSYDMNVFVVFPYRQCQLTIGTERSINYKTFYVVDGNYGSLLGYPLATTLGIVKIINHQVLNIQLSHLSHVLVHQLLVIYAFRE